MTTQNTNIIDQALEKPLPLSEKNKVEADKREKVALPEQVVERNIDTSVAVEKAQPLEKVGEGGLAGASQARQQAQARLKEVENVLAEDMEDIYVKLTPDKQEEFKRVGEETAQKITKILESAKISLRQIISLIRKWLSIVPGLNRFFLEQEAKIKADEIIRIKKEAGK